MLKCSLFSAISLSTLFLVTHTNAQQSSPTPRDDSHALNHGGLGNGGPIDFGKGPIAHNHDGPDHVCVPPEMEARIRANIEAFQASHPYFIERGAQTYDFYPQGGNWQRDISFGLFCDLDPTSGAQSFNCGTLTYDTHAGVDSGLRTFAEQAIGVPVFAALPGIVVARQDGFPDMNTSPGSDDGNYVIIDHGGGLNTWYLHMKNGSVLPALGAQVVAGQQIGMTASSGYSFGPHLHFQTMINNQRVEPFAGNCRPGPSLWENQNTFSYDPFIADGGISYIDLSTVPGNPHDVPRTGQLALTDDYHWIWTQIQNLPANSTFRLRWIRPNGTLAYQTDTFPFNNSEFYGRSWYWFWWWIGDMHTITGTWRIQMDINGVQETEMPVEVRTQRTVGFNRAPLALQGTDFVPAQPQPGEPVVCRVFTDLVLDDPDYDVVRYRYVWTINGQVVRDITSAAQSDMIPSGLTQFGNTLQCTVTPRDASLSGPQSVETITVGAPTCDSIDINNDDSVFDPQDIDAFLSVYSEGPCIPPTATCNDIDFNNDSSLFDPCDIDSFLVLYSEGPCTPCGT